jgi:hypothetical protein
MLSKLLKYETSATTRIFLPLFAAVLALAGIHRVFAMIGNGEMQFPEIISLTVYILVITGTFVMTLVVMIQRFYKNLLSEEGYLMFTLPVRPWAHIFSKLLIAMMWTFLSVIIALLSVMIIASEELMQPRFWQAIGDGLAEFYSIRGAGMITVEFIAIIILSSACNILMIYASIALGHLAGKQRILAAIGAYIGLNTAVQILAVLVGLIPGLVNMESWSYEINNMTDAMPLIQTALGIGLGSQLLLAVAFYAITHLVLTRRLNLE